jgi:hypothetical protein
MSAIFIKLNKKIQLSNQPLDILLRVASKKWVVFIPINIRKIHVPPNFQRAEKGAKTP